MYAIANLKVSILESLKKIKQKLKLKMKSKIKI